MTINLPGMQTPACVPQGPSESDAVDTDTNQRGKPHLRGLARGDADQAGGQKDSNVSGKDTRDSGGGPGHPALFCPSSPVRVTAPPGARLTDLLPVGFG